MLASENRLIQVKVNAFTYQYLQKYKNVFGISMSRFCELAINDAIIKRGFDFDKKDVYYDSAPLVLYGYPDNE